MDLYSGAIVIAFLLVSNSYFAYRLNVTKSELESLKKSQTKEIIAPAELKAFIADVMTGKLGMIAVTRVDTDNILYRSPRQ